MRYRGRARRNARRVPDLSRNQLQRNHADDRALLSWYSAIEAL